VLATELLEIVEVAQVLVDDAIDVSAAEVEVSAGELELDAQVVAAADEAGALDSEVAQLEDCDPPHGALNAAVLIVSDDSVPVATVELSVQVPKSD